MRLVLLISCVAFMMSAKSCKDYDVTGKQVAIIYPDQGVARVRTYQSSCPLKTSDAATVPLKELQTWCAVPPDVCAQYARDFEQYACK